MKRLSLELAVSARLGSLPISLSYTQQISASVFFHSALDNIIFPGQLLFSTESHVPCTTAQSRQTPEPIPPTIEFP
jgi:hypothetical protein